MAWISWEKLCQPKSEGGMGFKDLKAFNLALLAKQGWRLSKNTNSLTHRVFKAKYFAGCSFLEAQIGKKPSYVWISIMAAKEIVEKGSRWCIGNGKSVEIWRDRWIPTPDNFQVVTPQGPNGELRKVAQLIDEDTGMWKVDQVRKFFFPHEANVILGMPLSSRMPEDSLIWAWSKNGDFTVRSTYKVALKVLKATRLSKDDGECFDKGKMAGLWKLVWQLKCPNIIKHFLWRACKNILSTNFSLASRKVVSDNSCGFCGECESSGHILWDCVVAADVWRKVGINLPTVKQPMKNFIDVVWSLKEREGVVDWELFAIAAWMIWNNRNNFKHEGRCKESKRIALEAREYMQDAKIDHRPLCGSQYQARSTWCPPRQGSFKVNVNGAVFESLKV